MKTKTQWDKSKQNLSDFLQVGDVVDEEMKDYFIEVLPPACMSSRCIQIGEPFTHNAKGPMFETLIRGPDGWTYAGILNTPKNEKCLYVC